MLSPKRITAYVQEMIARTDRRVEVEIANLDSPYGIACPTPFHDNEKLEVTDRLFPDAANSKNEILQVAPDLKSAYPIHSN